MKKLFFYINGSGSPFWLDEKKDIYGNDYYMDLFYPINTSEKFNNEWSSVRILFDTYRNPIDRNFPSFWTQPMCNLFNNLVADFLTTATRIFYRTRISYLDNWKHYCKKDLCHFKRRKAVLLCPIRRRSYKRSDPKATTATSRPWGRCCFRE
jgi:hypothetical protein